MTRDEILNMPAGREMDELIAKNIMNWQRNSEYWVDKNGEPQRLAVWNSEYPEPFNPSENMNDAMQVLEKLNGPFSIARAWRINDKEWSGYSCWLGRGKIGISATAEKVPLSICRAVLLAVKELKE